MLDNRIYTFLELCNAMNYHKTAENLCMTQPAVTQHIQHFEQLYGCKLFLYAGRKLQKTPKCAQLEQTARAMVSMHLAAQQQLSACEKLPLRIGATKTIGEYMLPQALQPLLCAEGYAVSITIDNTKNLLEQLNHFALDVLLLEGFVDKAQYAHRPIATKELVGICAQNHPFAGRSVTLGEAFATPAILREQGSGTRAVLEHFLAGQGCTTAQFAHSSNISSNTLLSAAVAQGHGISFVYDMIPAQNKNLATFRLAEGKILHQLHCVFLNQEKANILQALLPSTYAGESCTL